MIKKLTRRCRAVIVTIKGERYLTRWRRDKQADELGPDEFPPVLKAIKAAERFAQRKQLKVRRIDAQYQYNIGETL